jgi:AraC family transcriptional regulator, dual regulator of chb operon
MLRSLTIYCTILISVKPLLLSYRDIAGGLPFHCAQTESSFIGNNLPFHTHDFEELFLVTEGSIQHEVPHSVELCKKGALQLVRCDDIHRLRSVKSEAGQIINVAFRAGQIDHHLHVLGHQKVLSSATVNAEEMRRLEECFRWLLARFIQAPRREQLNVFLTTCLEVLCRPQQHSQNGDYIDQAIADLELPNIAREGLSGLLNRTSVSLPHLCRTIKARTGLTPTELINSARLRHAKLMLSNTNASIDSIAYEVGFENTPYFHRVFKRAFDVSPGQFRAKQRAIVGSQ